MDSFTLRGRTAIITGGNRGIGFEIAKKLLLSGMNVAILGRAKEKLNEASERLNQIINDEVICRSYVCDMKQVSGFCETLEKIANDFQSIDVLVNNAGILDTSKIGTLTEELWDDVIDVNLKGLYFMIQEAVPYMATSKAARIINISSNAGRMGGYENGLAYTASKGGVIALTYGAARRLAIKGITVNCVAPGTIKTDMADMHYDAMTQRKLLAKFPIGRMGTPEDVASAVCFFSSEESGFITGAVLDVNGGMFMG